VTPQDEERRGELARNWLGNSIFKETWTKIEAGVLAKMKQPSTTSEEVLEWNRYLRLMDKLKRDIEQVAITGTMAAMEEERKRTWSERLLRR